jgi:hypothetical protein
MQVRLYEGWEPSPAEAICDAQSVKTGNPRCALIGMDGGKRVKGWKEYILVDMIGLLLMVIVPAANVSDPRGAKVLIWTTKHFGTSASRSVRFWADGGYRA